MSLPNVTAQVENFFSQFTAFSFKADEVLIRANQITPVVYYLKSGIIKQVATSPAGGEVTITMYKPGSFFPLIWAVKATPSPYEFRAVTNGHGWKAPVATVVELLKTHGDISFDLILRLLSGLEGLGRKVEFALQATALTRVSEALLTLAYRFGESHAAGVAVKLPLTHHDLAEITGLTRETVTRELKHLKEKGLILTDGGQLVVPDLSVLEQAIHGQAGPV